MADTSTEAENSVEDQEYDEPFTGAMLYCPVCCTADDGHKWGANKLTCNNCSTEYVVNINPDIVAEHAMVG